MEKNNFESYEYLPTNNGEPDADEFFVVQDDGTFLLNRQVQYVAQVQDVNEGLDSSHGCAVYDVTQQQFFVDVTDNPTELISVADNYILPTPSQDDSSNIYSNSFLLQVVPPPTTEQLEKPLPEVYKEQDALKDKDVINSTDKTGTSSCTEITLSDDQYKSLERKGWVLIENIDNKVFILDAYGLHDITSNIDLIENLKNNSTIEIDPDRAIKPDDINGMLKLENIYEINATPELDAADVISTRDANEEGGEILSMCENEDLSTLIETKLYEDKTLTNMEQLENQPLTINDKCRTLKIKTKCCFKDIPDKVVLGKTTKGKRLVAKVVKKNITKCYPQTITQKKPDIPPPDALATPTSTTNDKEDKFKSDQSQFEDIVQMALECDIKCSVEEVMNASKIVAQLAQVPAFQNCAKRNVIVTKVEGKGHKMLCVSGLQATMSIVTGVVSTDEDGSLRFTHVPDLLGTLMSEYIESKTLPQRRSSKSILKRPAIKEPDLNILHVNVSEMKYENNVETVAVVLNDRTIPCELFTTKRLSSKLHACSTCAALFTTKTDLIEHQESHSIEAEDTLMIDTDRISDDPLSKSIFPKRGDNNEEEYSCYQCLAKFNNLNSCLKHLKTHNISKTAPETTDCSGSITKSNTKVLNRTRSIYSCKMCSCSYFYASTLSKHINSVHIKNKITAYL